MTLFDGEAKIVLFRYDFMKNTVGFLGILFIDNIFPVNTLKLFAKFDNILMSHISVNYTIFTFSCLFTFWYVKYCIMIRYIIADYSLFMISGYVKVICENMVD